jgi:hypothetical protein
MTDLANEAMRRAAWLRDNAPSTLERAEIADLLDRMASLIAASKP